MDKELIKGVLIFVGAVVLIAGLFMMVSESGPDKAECIADALKAHIPVGNIDKVCRLSGPSAN